MIPSSIEFSIWMMMILRESKFLHVISPSSSRTQIFSEASLFLSPSSSKRFIIWRSLHGQHYYFERFLRLWDRWGCPPLKIKVITAQNVNCSLIAHYWWTYTVTDCNTVFSERVFKFRKTIQHIWLHFRILLIGKTVMSRSWLLDYSMFWKKYFSIVHAKSITFKAKYQRQSIQKS